MHLKGHWNFKKVIMIKHSQISTLQIEALVTLI